jgi:hypothetical protein
MDPSLGRPIEEAAVARFELEHPRRGFHDEGPHELLVVDPAAAGERIEKVRVERPSNPLTTRVTERFGDRSAAWSAAQSPAPPAPRIRMSVSTRSITVAPF